MAHRLIGVLAVWFMACTPTLVSSQEAATPEDAPEDVADDLLDESEAAEPAAVRIDGVALNDLAGDAPTPMFVWPVSAWVTSTTVYGTGEPHSGSADLAAPLDTPVGAARHGTVLRAGWTRIGGYLVEIIHEQGYATVYSHLMRRPLVAAGDVVQTDQVIGHLGRTGKAFRNGAHLHFALKHEGARLAIPGLDFGDWTVRGDPIPGGYPLDPVTRGTTSFSVRVSVPTSDVRSAPSASAPLVAALEQGTLALVTSSASGFYLVEVGAARGWIPMSTTVPADSNLHGLRVTRDARIRRSPRLTSEVIGTVEALALRTAFAEDGGWHRILYGVPSVYAWIWGGATEPSAEFEAVIRAPAADVRAGPGAEFAVVGALDMYDDLLVHENWNGWYRIEYAGQTAWVPGWLTQGRP